MASQAQFLDQPRLIQTIVALDMLRIKEEVQSGDVNHIDERQRSPLHLAAFKGEPEIVNMLIKAGAEVNARDCKGISPLHVACFVNSKPVVEILLKNNADIYAKDSLMHTPLHVAASSNSCDCLKLLLDNVQDVDVTDESGRTALHLAANNCHVDALRLLISKGSALNKYDETGRTPLIYAAQAGNADIINLLLEAGANIEAPDRNGFKALHFAAANGYDIITRALIDAGADVNGRNVFGDTALHMACFCDKQNSVDILLSANADVNISNLYGRCAIHEAACTRAGNECLNLLLSNNINANKPTWDGKTALHLTAINGYFTRSKALLDNGAMVNCKDNNGCTALHIAALLGHDLLMNTLISYGADPMSKGYKGQTPLHMSCRSGSIECCKKLMSLDIDVNAVDDHGMTPVHWTSVSGSNKCLELLISNNAACGVVDNMGRLPLHYSAKYGHYQMSLSFFEMGQSITAADKDGTTPLHFSAFKDRTGKCLEFMIERTPDLTIKDNLGYTPMHYAITGKNDASVQLLLRSGIYSGYLSASLDGTSPVHLAAKFGYEQILENLIKHWAQVNVRNNTGATPLMLASRQGHVKCVETLIESGAKVKFCDIMKMTALHFSAKNGHHQCLALLLEKESGKKTIDAANKLKITPLMIACAKNRIECVKLLLRHSLDVDKTVNAVDHKLRSSLFRAVVFGYTDILKLLLSHKAKPNFPDVHGKTAIHLAAASGYYACLKILLDVLSPEDVTVEDGKGCTALHWACYFGHDGCVQLLLETNLFQCQNRNVAPLMDCARTSGSNKCLQLLVNHFEKNTSTLPKKEHPSLSHVNGKVLGEIESNVNATENDDEELVVCNSDSKTNNVFGDTFKPAHYKINEENGFQKCYFESAQNDDLDFTFHSSCTSQSSTDEPRPKNTWNAEKLFLMRFLREMSNKKLDCLDCCGERCPECSIRFIVKKYLLGKASWSELKMFFRKFETGLSAEYASDLMSLKFAFNCHDKDREMSHMFEKLRRFYKAMLVEDWQY